jgi:hypothetical protein
MSGRTLLLIDDDRTWLESLGEYLQPMPLSGRSYLPVVKRMGYPLLPSCTSTP